MDFDSSIDIHISCYDQPIRIPHLTVVPQVGNYVKDEHGKLFKVIGVQFSPVMHNGFPLKARADAYCEPV